MSAGAAVSGALALLSVPVLQAAKEEQGGEKLSLADKTTFLTDDATGFVAASNTSGYGAYGYSVKKIPADSCGGVVADFLSAAEQSALLAVDTQPTLQVYTSADVYMYINASNLLYTGSNGAPLNRSITLTPGVKTRYRIRVTLTSIICELTDAADLDHPIWRNGWTYARTAGVDLYVHIYAAANKRFSNIKAFSRLVRTDVNFVIDGNSLTFGAQSGADTPYLGGWPKMLGDLPQYTGATFNNYAVSGQTTLQMLANPHNSNVLATLSTTKRNVFIAFETRNEIFFYGSARGAVDRLWQYFDAIKAYCVANNIKVTMVVCAPFDSDISNFGATPAATTSFGDNAVQFATKINAAADLIMQEYAAHADVAIDLRTIPGLAPITSTTSYDGTHLWAAAGYSLIRDRVDAVVRQYL